MSPYDYAGKIAELDRNGPNYRQEVENIIRISWQELYSSVAAELNHPRWGCMQCPIDKNQLNQWLRERGEAIANGLP